MKLQKALNIIKRSPSISLWRDESSGTQLLSNGYAAYDVSSWPFIETQEELAAILGIDDMKKHTFNIGEIPNICRPRNDGIPADRKYITINYRGYDHTFLDANGKIIAVNPKYLSPFDEGALYEYIDCDDGEIIAVGGFIKDGYVLPQLPDQKYKAALEEIYRGL